MGAWCGGLLSRSLLLGNAAAHLADPVLDLRVQDLKGLALRGLRVPSVPCAGLEHKPDASVAILNGRCRSFLAPAFHESLKLVL